MVVVTAFRWQIRLFPIIVGQARYYCSKAVSAKMQAAAVQRGLVLGVYIDADKNPKLTDAAQQYNEETDGKFLDLLKKSGPTLRKGKCRVLFGFDADYRTVAVVGLGAEGLGVVEEEKIHEGKEAVRTAVAVGCKALRDMDYRIISVDPVTHPEAAAEGATLSMWTYQDLKDEKKRKHPVELEAYSTEPYDLAEWEKGVTKAAAQNLARRLMETPANYMTPTQFTKSAVDALALLGVEVEVHDKEWAEARGMGAFLSVAKGSPEPPFFLEMFYEGSDIKMKPIVLVGKGITFDSGGISLKPSLNMDKMRADMGGGAAVVGALFAIAKLKLPVNVVGLVPLCENMPSGQANKPGDVVIAMNGKTIQVDNTDAEGRLILADALCYAHTFDPRAIVDIATLTGAINVALGSGAAGVFTNSTSLWRQLEKVSVETGDRVWRMPLWDIYTRQINDAPLADLNNIGKNSPAAGSCTAAAFLKEFVSHDQWMHIDIAGVMDGKDEVPYIGKGMTGRPTRTLIEFVARFTDGDDDKKSISSRISDM